jgi:hypothetical protein
MSSLFLQKALLFDKNVVFFEEEALRFLNFFKKKRSFFLKELLKKTEFVFKKTKGFF